MLGSCAILGGMTNSPKPGTYAKGNSVKVANSAAKAVALVFEGYQLQSEDVPVAPDAGTSTGPSSTSATPDTPPEPEVVDPPEPEVVDPPEPEASKVPVPRAPRGSR